ncbi:hypothetical protein GCM10011390_19290 [Aureimonas endophytica]|uniref:Uncharacterized protein n=1 Tax=Aureimonas endophytica TaxID=2027858 RepID=A0A916ZJ95_9HYPH|nr:hypothetical protein [Aureimonas endophytica]GGE00614.1 hypothetical protein GCM10011390_19290 [Aureimonas endophytica]
MIDGDVRATFDLPLVVAGYVLLMSGEDKRTDDEVVEAAIRWFMQMSRYVREEAYKELGRR